MDNIIIDVNKIGPEYSLTLSQQLEQGNILVLNNSPFLPNEEDSAFLRSQKQTGNKAHKNIAYKPNIDKTTGLDAKSEAEAARLHSIMSGYSKGAIAFMSNLLPGYAKLWKVDYASFRPEEEEGRELATKHRNDLMHIDAFPTRPTHGGRILRAFTNLNPTRDRVWGTTGDFGKLASTYAMSAGLKEVVSPMASARRALGKVVGMPDRSPYDEFMLQFHNYLKENDEFQQNGTEFTWAFPPAATWICFTDQVGHKVKSGQYAVEQTFIVPYEAMILPEHSPISVLEKLADRKLAVR